LKKTLKKIFNGFYNPGNSEANVPAFPQNPGYCGVCDQPVTFIEYDPWLRDNYKCSNCHSIPRNRALVNALNKFCPGWVNLLLHESSPGGPLSAHLEKSCKEYSSSYYYEDVPRGTYNGKYRSEDLTELSFADETFDVFVTSDVFEHVFMPEKAFKEIARVLKAGGAHVFTMPWYPELSKSRQRAVLENGEIVFLMDPVYHGNPISEKGSLVTYDWGRDFCEFIFTHSGMYTTIYLVENKDLGLKAEFLEVFISVKK